MRKDSTRVGNQILNIPISLSVTTLEIIESLFNNSWGYSRLYVCHIQIFRDDSWVPISYFFSFGQVEKILEG